MTKTQSSMIITIRSLFSFLSVLLVDYFYQRIGIRLGMFLAVLAGAFAFFIYSTSNNFQGYCVASAITGISHGLGGMYPISILINRWFQNHQGTALGICAAGSGIASIVWPPLVTMLIEKTTLPVTFQLQAAFVGMSALIVFFVVRNTPKEFKIQAQQSAQVEGGDAATRWTRTETASRISIACMVSAFLLLGMAANGVIMNIAMLYTTEGFEALSVSFLMSLRGISLTVGKFFYGYMSDRLGAQKSGDIFFGILVVGLCLICLAGVSGYPIAVCAMLLSGFGYPLNTVGVPVYAKDISSMKDYPVILKHLQITIILGGVIISPVPGIICDLTGSYIPAYILFSMCTVLSIVLIRLSYHFQFSAMLPKDNV